jgi:hypothetical protein
VQCNVTDTYTFRPDAHVNYDPSVVQSPGVKPIRRVRVRACACNIRTDSPPAAAFNSTIYNYYLLGEPNLVAAVHNISRTHVYVCVCVCDT